MKFWLPDQSKTMDKISHKDGFLDNIIYTYRELRGLG